MIDDNVAGDTLESYGLATGDAVEVELLVIGQPSQVAPRLVEGTVSTATLAVLVLDAQPGRRPVRIPWRAIALIRDAVHRHPATT